MEYKELIKVEDGCRYIHMGGGLYLVAARVGGEVKAKLAYNCDDLQCDYDLDWNMPTSGGGVVDTETAITGTAEEWAGWQELASDILKGVEAGTIDRW